MEHTFWRDVNLVVNALATKIQIEQPLVVINFEIELLVHLAS
jgi:hypothetical protein